MYFILNDLHKINPIYQFSLKAFSVVFNVAIERAEMADDVKTRVGFLTECITYNVFMYTTRGLFECDKLIFTAQMAFQILIMKKEVNPVELDFLLRFISYQFYKISMDFFQGLFMFRVSSFIKAKSFSEVISFVIIFTYS